MALDVRSICVALALSLLSIGVTMLISTRSLPPNLRRGAGNWSVACLVQTVGWTLLAARGYVADPVSILGGNVAIAFSLSFHYRAIKSIRGENWRLTETYWPVAVIAVTFFVFTLVTPNFWLRVLVISAVGAVYLSICAYLLFGISSDRTVSSFRLTGAGFGLLAVTLGARAVTAFMNSLAPSTQSLLVADHLQQLFFLLIFLAVYLVSFAFVLMTAEALTWDLARLATLDPLTEIFNRRTLEDLGAREAARSRRDRSPLSVLMFDIDHFKSVNDAYGHPVGDAAIKHIVEVVREATRDEDVLARYGGEEFIVLMPATDVHAANHAAERVREKVATSPLSSGNGKVSLSVSVGVATAAGAATSFKALVEASDEALYAAKRAGRNCVVVAGASPAAPEVRRAAGM